MFSTFGCFLFYFSSLQSGETRTFWRRGELILVSRTEPPDEELEEDGGERWMKKESCISFWLSTSCFCPLPTFYDCPFSFTYVLLVFLSSKSVLRLLCLLRLSVVPWSCLLHVFMPAFAACVLTISWFVPSLVSSLLFVLFPAFVIHHSLFHFW